MVKSTILANAVATIVGVGYVLCRLIAAVAPQLIFNIGQSWFHTLNLEMVRATRPVSLGILILGLVSSMVVAWVGTYAVALLYNRWARKYAG